MTDEVGEGTKKGSRKLIPLVMPVSDKSQVVGENEISWETYWTNFEQSEDILSYSD